MYYYFTHQHWVIDKDSNFRSDDDINIKYKYLSWQVSIEQWSCLKIIDWFFFYSDKNKRGRIIERF